MGSNKCMKRYRGPKKKNNCSLLQRLALARLAATAKRRNRKGGQVQGEGGASFTGREYGCFRHTIVKTEEWEDKGVEAEVVNGDEEDSGHSGLRSDGDGEVDQSFNLSMMHHNYQHQFCFLCCGNVADGKRKSKFVSGSNLRANIMKDYVFFLRELLEIPMDQSDTYLGRLGESPELWMKLCVNCRTLIVTGRKVKEQLAKLEAQLERCQQEVVETMKEKGFAKIPKKTLTTTARREDSASEIDPSITQTLLQIKNFVARKQYQFSKSKVEQRQTGRKLPPQKMETHPSGYDDAPASESFHTGGKTITLNIPAANENYSVLHPFFKSDSTLEDSEPDLEDEDLIEQNDLVGVEATMNQEEMDDPLGTVAFEAEMGMAHPDPPLQVTKNPFYCGLCNDEKDHGSEEELTTHTTSCHNSRPGHPEEQITVPMRMYDCPNCSNVRRYTVIQYAQHLRIHLRLPYQCRKCSEFFPANTSLQEQHWREKHSENQNDADAIADKFVKVKFDPGQMWKCEGCFEGFYSEMDRDEHERSCERITAPTYRDPLQCQLCLKSSRSFPEWRLHRAIYHSEIDRMSCYYCDKSFSEKTVEGLELRHDLKMHEHMRNEHSGSYSGKDQSLHECSSCGLVFESQPWYKKHFLEQHGIPGNQVNRCEVCQTTYSSYQSLRKHVSIRHFRSESCICDVCGHNCVKRVQLAQHRLVQHGIGPGPEEGFKILYCPKEGCSFQTIQQNNLRNHIKAIHENSEKPRARPHQCKYCEKTFTDSGKLRDHLETHENKESKPYQCEICGNSFAVKNYLYIHKRLTHEKRTFPSTDKKKPTKPRTGKVKSKPGEATTNDMIDIPPPPLNQVEGGELNQRHQSDTQVEIPEPHVDDITSPM